MKYATRKSTPSFSTGRPRKCVRKISFPIFFCYASFAGILDSITFSSLHLTQSGAFLTLLTESGHKLSFFIPNGVPNLTINKQGRFSTCLRTLQVWDVYVWFEGGSVDLWSRGGKESARVNEGDSGREFGGEIVRRVGWYGSLCAPAHFWGRRYTEFSFGTILSFSGYLHVEYHV